MAKYVRKRWSSIPVAKMELFSGHLVTDLVEAKAMKDCCKVSCVPCKIVLFKSIKLSNYYAWWSIKEQRHFNSAKHRHNVLLEKLAG